MDPKQKVYNALLNVLGSMHQKETGHEPFSFDKPYTQEIDECKTCQCLISLTEAIGAEFYSELEKEEEKPIPQRDTCGTCMYWQNYNYDTNGNYGMCMRTPGITEYRYDNDIACMHLSPAESKKEIPPPEPKNLVCPMCQSVLVPAKIPVSDSSIWSFGYRCKCTEELRLNYFYSQEAANE